jgi:hypothetical protein
MAKRRTIGKDPLADAATEPVYSAEIVRIPLPAAVSPAAAEPDPVAAEAEPEPTVPAHAEPPRRSVRPLVGKARHAIGGLLEILGGDCGVGARAIWPRSDDELGFVAPSGRRIDLARELARVRAWSDRTDRRYLSAVGWACVLGSLGGVVGLLAGGGIRLLEPRRMIVTLHFADGTKLVARTDRVTVTGLEALAGAAR